MGVVQVMRRSRNFRQGGGGGGVQAKLTKKALFLVLSLFYTSHMVNFKENYPFQGSRGGPTFSGGGGGGVQLVPGGGGPTFSRGGGGPIAYFL